MFKQIFEMFKSDSLYEQALSECHEMLEIDREMFNESINALRTSDSAEIPIDIYAMDKKINSFERDVRRKVMTHLAISGSQDLGSGLILTSVVIDIERIGDYTKNIYDLAVSYPKKLNAGTFEDKLTTIEHNTKDYFNRTIDTFKTQDIDSARELMGNYKEELQCLTLGILVITVGIGNFMATTYTLLRKRRVVLSGGDYLSDGGNNLKKE